VSAIQATCFIPKLVSLWSTLQIAETIKQCALQRLFLACSNQLSYCMKQSILALHFAHAILTAAMFLVDRRRVNAIQQHESILKSVCHKAAVLELSRINDKQ
jgi:hypothetical protein